MRVIIRFSIDNDSQSLLRNSLVYKLETLHSFKKASKTSTYEYHSTSPVALSKVLSDFWHVVESHKGSATIDHFWMYVDQD